MLGSALDSALRQDGFFKQAVPDGLRPGEAENNGRKWNGRFNVFTALVDGGGNVIVQAKVSFLQEELDSEAIEELVRTAAASSSYSGVLPASHLRYLKRDVGNSMIVAFADTSGEASAMAELVKNSLIVGLATLLVFFGASLLLARWAVRPVEKAWQQQKQFVGDASHELAHFLGITSEAEANFYAYQVCTRSQVKEIRFPGLTRGVGKGHDHAVSHVPFQIAEMAGRKHA